MEDFTLKFGFLTPIRSLRALDLSCGHLILNLFGVIQSTKAQQASGEVLGEFLEVYGVGHGGTVVKQGLLSFF